MIFNNKDEEEKKLRRAEYEAGYDSGFDAGKETELNNLLHRMLKNRKYSDTDIAEVTGIAAEKIKSKKSRTGGDISPPVFSLFMKGFVDSNRNS
mgnify:CR=1 FL=1